MTVSPLCYIPVRVNIMDNVYQGHPIGILQNKNPRRTRRG